MYQSNLPNKLFLKCKMCGHETNPNNPKLSMVNHLRHNHCDVLLSENFRAEYLVKYILKKNPLCKRCGTKINVTGFKHLSTFCSPACSSLYKHENGTSNFSDPERISKQSKRLWDDPTFHKKMVKIHNSPYTQKLKSINSSRYNSSDSVKAECSIRFSSMWDRQKEDPEFMKKWGRSKSKSLSKVWERPEYRKRMSEVASKNAIWCLENIPGYGRGRTKKDFKYGSGVYRSSWEVAFAKKCRELKVKFQYEKKVFMFDIGDGSNSRYMPDFYLPKFDVWVEVKPKDLQKGKAVWKLKELRKATKCRCVFITIEQIRNLSKENGFPIVKKKRA